MLQRKVIQKISTATLANNKVYNGKGRYLYNINISNISYRNFSEQYDRSHLDIKFNTLLEMQIKSCEINKKYNFLGH